MIRRSLLYLLVVTTVFMAWDYRQRTLLPPSLLPSYTIMQDANALKWPAGPAARKGVEIPINEPVELDGLSRAEIYRLRNNYVEPYAFLVAGDYHPSESVFGQIADAKPWWGITGQFCYGDGDKSIEGPSEESRFIANPFALLYLDTYWIFRMERDCVAAYPRPQRFSWLLEKPQAYLSFDLSRFFREREAQGLPTWTTAFSFDHLNARDFGYNFLFIDPQRSRGVKPTGESLVLKQPCYLRGFIHLGSSCRYPGGCNNGSPYQPELYFTFANLPARLVCLLWKRQPRDKKQPADFEYVVEAF